MNPRPLRLEDEGGNTGQELGVSPWLVVDQARIDLFAKAIDDMQWIHVDPLRARDGPFGGTIAHGFLTLSLLSHLFSSTFLFEGRSFGVNYGLNKVRFTAPLRAGARVRARFVLLRLAPLPSGGLEHAWSVTVEQEGSAKPVLVAEWLLRNH